MSADVSQTRNADHAHGDDDSAPYHHHHHPQHHDHSLRGAYLHVMADALTSILAIVARLGGSIFGWAWIDAMMGIVGAGLVLVWAASLARKSGSDLLDREGAESVAETVRTALENHDTRVADLHLWSVGAAGYAAALSVVSDTPLPADAHKRRIPSAARIVHATVEVHRCPGAAA